MADVEALLIPWLASTLSVRAVTDLPANLEQVLPVVQVLRIGGGDDDEVARVERPSVSVDYYAPDRASAQALAHAGHLALREQLAGHIFPDGSTALRCLTISGPAWRPYDQTVSLRRFGATYSLILRIRP